MDKREKNNAKVAKLQAKAYKAQAKADKAQKKIAKQSSLENALIFVSVLGIVALAAVAAYVGATSEE